MRTPPIGHDSAEQQPTRREFVASSAALFGSGWLWLQLPALASLSACARDAAQRNEAFVTFTTAEGAAMRALAARIIPSDDELPGADEAGAVWFADRALSTFFDNMLEPVRAGLADLDSRSRNAHGADFAALSIEQQDAIINDVAESQFFFFARLLTVAGVFADPRYGGNRDHAGFTILDMQHAPAYQPPFGSYDAEYARNGGVA